MQQNTLEKLEWPRLLSKLTKFCHTEEASQLSNSLAPSLNSDEIKKNWELVEPLRKLANQGYRAPIGELIPLNLVFRNAKLGQILEGEQLRAVFSLLRAVEKVYSFVTDFSDRCQTLARISTQIYPLPKLAKAIDQAVDEGGVLRDEASKELTDIRKSQRNLRKRIETDLQKMLHGQEFEQYLQDDFFTIRSDRYVVPIRLDGRGRIKGSILDTSASGQTLYIEPAAIANLNEQIQELDLAEKLEIIRIFKTLSQEVKNELEILQTDYQELVRLDFLSAQAEFAIATHSNVVQFEETPIIGLINAKHPLLGDDGSKPSIGNNINLSGEQNTLIISGPNAGGKTVILETLGLLHIMAKAGLMIPAHEESSLYLFDNIFLEMGDAQDITANLSTFSGHIFGLKNILDKSSSKDLVLLDELAVGTEPETGSAIAQAVLESLSRRNAISVSTTHYDNLKGIAVSNPKFRNGSMEFSVKSLKPTYKLILDVPGQSYGIEVAEDMGLSPKIIERAKELRGHTASSLDSAVAQLAQAREKSQELQIELEQRLLEVKAEKDKWERETQAIAESRRKTASSLSERFDDELKDMKSQYAELTKEIRKDRKKNDQQNSNIPELKKQIDSTLNDYQEKLTKLNTEFETDENQPGKLVEFAYLEEMDKIYLTSIKKEATIHKLGNSENDPIEVEIGLLKMRILFRDLRFLSRPNPNSIKKQTKKLATYNNNANKKRQQLKKQNSTELVLPTARNTCDVRGLDLDDAKTKTWAFIDAALLRGDYSLIIIHGHGTDRLKKGIRASLDNDSPYELSHRAGNDQEGGNGTTVVYLKY